jgi:vitamin B12 transporter
MIPKSLSGFFLPFFLFFSASLAHAAEELEPIVVKRAPLGSAGEAASVVITKEEIKNIPAKTPEEVLNYVGADIQTRGQYGIKSDISLNGSTFQQVLILVNGARVNDSQTAHQDLDLFFNVSDIERIEIIPAAASAKYGPDGIGGAINFVLKNSVQEMNSVSASGGNHDTFEQKLNLSYPFLKSRNRLSITNVTSNGFHSDTDYRTDTFFHSTALEGDSASLYVDAGYNQKAFGAFDFYTPGLGFPSKEWINTKFVDVRSVLKNEAFTFEPRLNFRQHQDKFVLDITQPDLYINHHTTDTFVAGGRLSVPSPAGDLGGGADYGEERILSNNLGKHIRGHWDVYLDPTFEGLPGSSLSLALRMDDYTTFNEEFTGSILYKHLFEDKSSVYGTFGRMVRVPTFTELYYSDPTTAGDPNLKPENALGFESGWQKAMRCGLDISFSFFVRQEHDTIDFTKLAPTDAKFIARNISEAMTFGTNSYLKWQVCSKMSLDLRYVYANKRLKDSGAILKYGPSFMRHMVDLGMDNELPFGHNRVDLVTKKKPDRCGWVLVNDRFSYAAAKSLELFVEVNNLFNVKYEEIVGIPEPRRLWKIGSTFRW